MSALERQSKEGRMAERQNYLPLLKRLDRGRAMMDVFDGLSQVVEAIENNRGDGSGTVTLKITVKSEGEGTYTLEPEVTVKVPKPKRLKTTAFLGNDGELIDRDPRQPDLPGVVPLREVNVTE